jgi:hypothetical protein
LKAEKPSEDFPVTNTSFLKEILKEMLDMIFKWQ